MRLLEAILYVILVSPIFENVAANLRNKNRDRTAIGGERQSQLSQLVRLPFSIIKTAELKKFRRHVKAEENNAEKKQHMRRRHRRRCKNRDNCFNRTENTLKEFPPENRKSESRNGSLNRKKNNGLKSMKLSTKTLPKIFVQSRNVDYNIPGEFDADAIKDLESVSGGTNFLNTVETFFSGGNFSGGNNRSWLSSGYNSDDTLELLSTRSIADNDKNHDENSFEKSLFSIYMDYHNPMYNSLINLMTELFQSLNNSVSNEYEILPKLNLDSDNVENESSDINTDNDFCQRWLDTKDKLDAVFLGPSLHLPACPCFYPSKIFYNDNIWDKKQEKYFRWRDVSSESQRLDVYKPGATYCVRSLLSQGSSSAAAQHCCYDRQRKLLTRGSGAGTPYFVSPEASPLLHEKIDVLPWQLCKGDFSRFHKMRPPNNDNDCELNPDDEEYQRQKNERKSF